MLILLAILVLIVAVLALAVGSRRWFGRLVVVGVLLIIVSSVISGDSGAPDPAPSPAPDPADLVYVALGDSYASGEGIGQYYASTSRRTDTSAGVRNRCHRSQIAYPELVSSRLSEGGQRVVLRNVTCSGARADDFDTKSQYSNAPPQLDSLDASVDLVTIQLGGNDLGFGEVIARCVDVKVFHARTPCAPEIADGLAARLAIAQAALDRVLPKVRERAPSATVIVVGYPIVVEDDEVRAGSRKRCAHIRAADVPTLIDANAQVNAVVQDAAERNGYGFVAAGDVFADHGLCGAGDDWINGIDLAQKKRGGQSFLARESFHPNADGHAALAESLLVSPLLRQTPEPQ